MVLRGTWEVLLEGVRSQVVVVLPVFHETVWLWKIHHHVDFKVYLF